jgi:hypothetical protein
MDLPTVTEQLSVSEHYSSAVKLTLCAEKAHYDR